jgi:hypothetical protein
MVVDAGYSSRAHFIAGQQLRRQAPWFGVPVAVLTVAASSGAAVLVLFGIDKAWVALFAFAAAMFGALEHYFDPATLADAHSLKGDRYLTVGNEARLFRNVRLLSADGDGVLQQELAVLRHRYDELREAAPRQLPPGAYEKARAQIRDGQASYEDDPLWVQPPATLS